ncbi:MAG: FAD-dependent oxidoreductase [candidate division NC10 bacterium]|nr:FAD-dependent oxidoreductase [candidate division NC10 bacterium]
MASFPRLFEPGRIGGLEVRNRIISAPMERNYCNRDGSVTQRYIDYLEARARGGVGLFFTEASYVDPRGKGRAFQLGVHDDAMLPGLTRLVQAVHRHGAKIGLELNYGGRVVAPEVSGLQPWAPSAVPCKMSGGAMPHVLSVEEMQDILRKFGEAARRSREAGCDIIEIHGAHGYLLGQFLSSVTNQRTDAYGGPLANRMRFLLEVIREVKRQVGDDFPLAVRVSADEYVDGGIVLPDTLEVAKAMEAAGVHLIDISGGNYESAFMIVQPMEIPLGCHVPLAAQVRSVVKIPVSVAGRINDPTFAALHADPEFPNKARQGRLEDICYCMACNQGCIDVLSQQIPIFCTINTATGRERDFAIRPAARPRRILVIGGGPAGMEAARVAALRGHRVTLVERAAELGGQIRYAMRPTHKGEFGQIVRYLSHQIKTAGVEIRLKEEATLALVQAEQPDVVVVATGARPFIPPIPGVAQPHVATLFDVYDGRIDIRGRVCLFGANLAGVELAEYLAQRDADVLLVDPGKAMAADAGLRAKWLLLERVEQHPRIDVRLNTTLEEIAADAVLLQSEGKMEWLRPVAHVVLAAGGEAENRLLDSLKREWPGELYSIGDCVYPRRLNEATYEGALVGHRV